MFNLAFVQSATHAVEFETAQAENQEALEEYAEPTLKEIEDKQTAIIKKQNRQCKSKRVKAAFHKNQAASHARRKSQIAAALTSSTADELQLHDPIVQRLTGSYRRACRNDRQDTMNSLRDSINEDIAPKMTSRDRRKLWKSLSNSATKFKKKPNVVLQPTWEEQKKLDAAKTNWSQACVQCCLVCGVFETEIEKCGAYGSGFLPLVPCGHRVMCQTCSEVVQSCPSCLQSIDHAMSKFLRPQTPVVYQLNDILSDIRSSRSDNLGLVRRAALARVRDARHITDNTSPILARGKPVKGDRTSRILHDLGTAAGINKNQLQQLDIKWEASIEKACHESTASEGQNEMLRLFAKLSPRITTTTTTKTITTAVHAEGVQHNADEVDSEIVEDMFTLQRSDNTAWTHPRKGIHLIWHYDEHTQTLEDKSITYDELPYVAQHGPSRMQRFKGKMNPRVNAIEVSQILLEKRMRTKEEDSKSNVHLQREELKRMMTEDKISHLSRYWSKSLAERENMGSEGMDLGTIEEQFRALTRNYKKAYARGWFKEYEEQILRHRGARSAVFALRMAEIQRLGACLVSYQKSCKERSVGMLGELERIMAKAANMPCIRASSVSEKHVLCLIDLLNTSSSVDLKVEIFILSFSRLNPFSSAQLGNAFIELCHLRHISIQNCQSKDNAVCVVLEIIADKCLQLEELDLSHNKMCDTKQMNASLTELVASKTLRKLDLSHNALRENTGVAIAEGLKNHSCHIEVINISWNALRKEGSKAILTVLRQKSNESNNNTGTCTADRFKTLDISYNGFRLDEVNIKLQSSCKVLAEGTRAPGWGEYESRFPAPRVQTPPLRRRAKSKKKKSGGGKKKNKRKK